ncbi:MAG TPA: AAA family ATPase, partial [Gaiellaceae bacterium]|nr:AAA family ATPase [Gaiellaceae bacterium]
MTTTAFEILGRDEELAAVDSFLAGARPAALVFEGEAGIGKTTLWRYAVDAARAQSALVLTHSAVSAEAQLSFTALADLLGDVIDDVLSSLPPPQQRALRVALLLEEVEESSPDPRAVFAALTGLLHTLAAQRPVVVAVDDVQWLDGPSSAALEYAVRRLAHQPVAFLIARRGSPSAPLPLGLGRALPEERVRRLELGPLTLGALRRLLHTRLEVGVGGQTLRQIHQTSGGNVLFALEIARALQRREIAAVPGEPLGVPATLQELVRERIAALPSRTRDALAVAAAALEPTLALVGEIVEADALPILTPALETDVAVLEGNHIRFPHPLLAAAAYESSRGDRRRDLHRRLADVARDPEERARHLAIATDIPDESVASELEKASAEAAARGAPDTAADLAAAARRLTPPERTRDVRRRTLAEADHRFHAGDTVRARSLLEEFARATVKPDSAVLLRIARLEMFGVDPGRAAELAESALRLPDLDPAVRAELEESLAWSLHLMRRNDSAAEHARAAVAAADEAGDPSVLVRALSAHLLCELLVGRRLPNAAVERFAALAPAARRLELIRDPTFTLAVLLVWSGGPERAQPLLLELHRRAHELGEATSIPFILSFLTRAETRLGEWESAIQHAQEGFEIAVQNDQKPLATVSLANLALVEAYRGDVESARANAAAAIDFDPPLVVARRTALWAVGMVELSLGDAQAAAGVFQQLAAQVEAEGLHEPGELPFFADYVEALTGAGRLEEAWGVLAGVEQRAAAVDRAPELAA